MIVKGSGNTSLDALIKAGEISVETLGNLSVRGNIQAQNVLLESILGDVWIESQKTRTTENGPNEMSEQVTLTRIHAQEILKVVAGRDLHLVGEKTWSGVMTHLKGNREPMEPPC